MKSKRERSKGLGTGRERVSGADAYEIENGAWAMDGVRPSSGGGAWFEDEVELTGIEKVHGRLVVQNDPRFYSFEPGLLFRMRVRD
jgi:hypothetical protein